MFDPLEPIEPPEPQYTVTVTAEPVRENPNTGDNSHLTLWFALLAVSAAGVIGTGVHSKRRRSS